MMTQIVHLDCPRCGAALGVEVERDAVYPGGWIAEGDCVLPTCGCDLDDGECEVLADRAMAMAALPALAERSEG